MQRPSCTGHMPVARESPGLPYTTSLGQYDSLNSGPWRLRYYELLVFEFNFGAVLSPISGMLPIGLQASALI